MMAAIAMSWWWGTCQVALPAGEPLDVTWPWMMSPGGLSDGPLLPVNQSVRTDCLTRPTSESGVQACEILRKAKAFGHRYTTQLKQPGQVGDRTVVVVVGLEGSGHHLVEHMVRRAKANSSRKFAAHGRFVVCPLLPPFIDCEMLLHVLNGVLNGL
jgi:hypothetical protein